MIVGPVLLRKPKGIGEYKKIAEENGIAFDVLVDKISGLKRFNFNSMESTVELLREVMRYIVELSCTTKRLSDKFVGMPKKLDVLIKEIYSSAYFEKLLSTLLDVSLHTTKGSAGSIMLLDEDNDELSVKFSRGIKDDIAKDARVKIGKGISGLVAKNKKPLLIDDSVKNTQIKNRLKRPYIKSSIVYPIEVRNRIFGVLNLNNIDETSKFSPETLDLTGNLIKLTKVAIDEFIKEGTFF